MLRREWTLDCVPEPDPCILGAADIARDFRSVLESLSPSGSVRPGRPRIAGRYRSREVVIVAYPHFRALCALALESQEGEREERRRVLDKLLSLERPLEQGQEMSEHEIEQLQWKLEYGMAPRPLLLLAQHGLRRLLHAGFEFRTPALREYLELRLRRELDSPPVLGQNRG